MQVKNFKGESSFWKQMKQKFQVKAKSHPKHGFIPMALLNGEVLYYLEFPAWAQDRPGP